jgi:hypothetical protein
LTINIIKKLGFDYFFLPDVFVLKKLDLSETAPKIFLNHAGSAPFNAQTYPND